MRRISENVNNYSSSKVNKITYIGLFIVTVAILMFEILLTRIFSVTMWYHLAFVAVSVAMFGMTAGAILVYLFPNYFREERAKHHLAVSSLLFAVSIVFSFLTYLSIPLVRDVPFYSLVALYSLALTYLVISIPFVFGGICVCLALTKFPRQVSKLYAADLAGAAVGCILLIYALRFTDGPTAVMIVAFLASLGAVFFAIDSNHKRLKRAAVVSCSTLALLSVVHTVLVHKQIPVLQLVWIRGGQECPSLYEKWNSFSRIRVWGDMDEPTDIFGWGMSSEYPPGRKERLLHMSIDAAAYTPITAFNGEKSELDYLKYDLTNIAHHIRSDAKVLVIGSGGGRDILSAMVFDQKSVLAVEINNEIINTVNKKFGDFSGHLDRYDNTTIVCDEARSYIARQKDKYDIIQSSLIDTWAASAAGAFVLTENSVYTVEAWKTFLEHLTPKGILSFSRWYDKNKPSEMYRLTSLASVSLAEINVENPRSHIIVAGNTHLSESGVTHMGVGTILVSRTPFSNGDLDTIEQVARQLKFEILLSPRSSVNTTFEALGQGGDIDKIAAASPLNISPPTDNNPFFFHMLRFRDMFNTEIWKRAVFRSNLMAVVILGSLLIVVLGLTFLCIIVPLILTTEKSALKGSRAFFLFFAAIGFGFMLVEISQLQRLTVFLGHPTYSLSVVLFALLLSGGLGSYTTWRIDGNRIVGSGARRLLFLLLALFIFGTVTPFAIDAFRGSVTPLRIFVATAVLFPLGFFMGMAFPLGMKIASGKPASLTPWLWGINGATSVCASVLAVVIALGSGISVSFWTGTACYAVAFAAFIWAGKRPSPL